MRCFDILFVGHVCYDEIVPFKGETRISLGSAVLQGATTASRIGKKIGIITKMSKKDLCLLKPMKDLGIFIHVINSAETSYMQVIHPSQNIDEREMILKHNAGYFTIDDFPSIENKHLHLAGISDQEFTLDFIKALKKKGYNISVDMQSFIRQADPETHSIDFSDVSNKKEIINLMDKVKLDIVEAKILTGQTDLKKAAKIISTWGCSEIMITHADGVLVLKDTKFYYEKFTNKSSVGRTGRGDTTFAAYLSKRIDSDVEFSIKFAASLVSIKMESLGPFDRSHEEVLERMKLDGRI